MRLLNFLKLNTAKPTLQDIEQNCPRAWRLFQNPALLRGLDSEDEIFKAEVRTDRKPLHSSKYWHNAMNEALKNVFGKFLRSCSLFCTGNKNQASVYGNVYKIYPSNDFEFYWSPYVQDLLNIGDDLSYKIKNFPIETRVLITTRISDEFEMQKLKREFLKPNNSEQLDIQMFIEKNFPSNILNKSNGLEIIFNETNKKFPNALTNLVKQIYVKGNYEQAIKSGNEIMVTCSYYYGVKY